MELKKSQNPSNQIVMSVNDGFEYKTPVLLSKALKVIDNLPSSMVLKDNYAMFENQEKERIRFKRVFNNKWTISIFPIINEKNSMSIEYSKSKGSNLLIVIKIALLHMKTGDVCRLLQVTKVILYKYQKEGKISGHKLPNGYWNWNDESVYSYFNKDVPCVSYAYTRVSTNKQKPDLETQIHLLKQWCFCNGIQLNGLFSDVVSGISFEKRKNFFKMLEQILQKCVKQVIITYKDRLRRVGFEFFSFLFKQFGTEIVVISEMGNTKLDSQEVMEEIISLMHCFTMKMYSKRKIRIIKELIQEEH